MGPERGPGVGLRSAPGGGAPLLPAHSDRVHQPPAAAQPPAHPPGKSRAAAALFPEGVRLHVPPAETLFVQHRIGPGLGLRHQPHPQPGRGRPARPGGEGLRPPRGGADLPRNRPPFYGNQKDHMKTNRIKNTQPVIRTREAMESLIGEIAALQNQQRLLTAAMDGQIQDIREQYEAQLAAQNEALDQKMEHARAWSEANPHEFGAARSIETVHGTVGWRTGQPALKTVPGWTFTLVPSGKDCPAAMAVR